MKSMHTTHMLSALILIIIILGTILLSTSTALTAESDSPPLVTVYVEVNGIKHVPGNSFAFVTLASVSDNSEASTQLFEISFGESCNDANNMCGRAEGAFTDVESDVDYNLMVCHTRRRTESGCKLGTNGQTIDPGEIRKVTPTEKNASYTFNLENRYLMHESGKSQEKSPLDAIEAVATAGAKRGRPWRRRALMAGLLTILVTCVAGAAYLWNDRPMQLPKLPVAVLLPDMEKGLVADNAARQWAGFKLALEDNQAELEDLHEYVHHFNYPIQGREQKQALIDILERWYQGGKRVFIITMSGAVTAIKTEFIQWAESKPEYDRPILVATVASAPGVADREKGVFRHYIRSKDESNVLATYIESQNTNEVKVFYVNDKYGQEAWAILDERLSSLGITMPPSPVELSDNEEKIQNLVRDWMRDSIGRENGVVVIVGYGLMVNRMLEALRNLQIRDNRFEGKILVVSTLTEEIWRPNYLGGDSLASNDPQFASRIYTVGPGKRDPDATKNGVVFQFSYLTLDRAIACGQSRGIDAFWNCWRNHATPTNTTGQQWSTVEFMADGDSYVWLQLLQYEQLVTR